MLKTGCHKTFFLNEKVADDLKKFVMWQKICGKEISETAVIEMLIEKYLKENADEISKMKKLISL